MADNINTMTPGSAVADQLQQILTQRRADQRQKMLDTLNVNNVQSEMDYRGKQAESLAEDRAAQAQQRRAQAEAVSNRAALLQHRKTALPALLNDPQFGQLGPSEQSMRLMAEFPEDEDLTKAVMTRMIGNEDKPKGGDVLVRMPDGSVVDSGQWAEPGQKVVDAPYPPQANAANAMGLYQVPDPNDPTKTVSAWLTPGEVPGPNTKYLDGIIRKGNQPPPPTKKGSNVSASESNALGKLRGKATDVPGGWFGFGGKKATDQDKAAYAQQANTTISNYPTSSDVKDTVRDVLAKEDPSVSNEDIIKTHAKAFSKPEELEQFGDLLNVVR